MRLPEKFHSEACNHHVTTNHQKLNDVDFALLLALHTVPKVRYLSIDVLQKRLDGLLLSASYVRGRAHLLVAAICDVDTWSSSSAVRIQDNMSI